MDANTRHHFCEFQKRLPYICQTSQSTHLERCQSGKFEEYCWVVYNTAYSKPNFNQVIQTAETLKSLQGLFAQRRKLQFPFAIFSQIAQQVSLRARCICKESPQVPTLLKSKKKPPSCQVLQENRNSFDVILAKADTLKQLACLPER